MGEEHDASIWTVSRIGTASDAVHLGPNTVTSHTTTTIEETAVVAVVEAVVGDVVEITVAAGQHPDLPGGITSQEAGGN